MLKLAKVAPLAVGISLLMTLATAARAEPVRQDRPEHVKVIVCAAQDEAKTPQGLLPCAVGPARLVVVVQENADRKRNG